MCIRVEHSHFETHPNSVEYTIYRIDLIRILLLVY